ncbi:MAG: hypothetical protein AAF266_11355 [Planctomycetota bacterium]
MPRPALWLLLPALLLAVPASGQRLVNEAGDDQWVRALKNDDGEPTALQTAVARYVGRPAGSRAPVVVDLIGAIHVGDKAYYKGLDQRFRKYDALLYELVAPEGTVVQRGAKVDNRNALGALQSGMQGMLALEHQLEQVDYTRPNFVHADMSPETLFATMESRDEGFLQMYFRMVGQSIAEQTKAARRGESAEFDMMKALFAKDRPRQLKIAMASQLTQLEGLLTSFGGEKGSTLIHERNRTAMDVLAREIAGGKKALGIFYGAGHLADMDKRLRERFGLRQIEKEWVTAWDLSE